MVPADAQLAGTWVNIMKRLEPILLSLNDFAAVVAWALGMNGKVAAIIWGSIRLILKVLTPCSMPGLSNVPYSSRNQSYQLCLTC